MSTFRFREFVVAQDRSAMKVGTDALLLGAMISTTGASQVLEIGAGTGVISLMLAQREQSLRITAIEIDEPSSEDCQLNFQNSAWKDRLNLIQGDLLTTSFESKFDLVVSNPPFYSDSLQNKDERKSRAKHEAFLPFDKLFKKSSELLSSDGKIWIIIPSDAKERVVRLCREKALFVQYECLINGKPGHPVRYILCFSKHQSSQIKREAFTIRESNGKFSPEYVALTIDFHDRAL